jgi:hypothetical protein
MLYRVTTLAKGVLEGLSLLDAAQVISSQSYLALFVASLPISRGCVLE